MKTRSDQFTVAAVGDLHVHENSPNNFRGLFSAVSDKADVLLLCGDLTNLGLPSEAVRLKEDLKSCKIPVLAVLGNHDHHSGKQEEVKAILRTANVIFLEDDTYEMGDVGFAGVKGFGGGFDNHMVVAFGEEAIRNFVTEGVNESLKLENSLKALETKHKVVAMHYSPISATVAGEAEQIHAFLGSSRLAEAVDRFEVAAVFHGHAHHGAYEGRTAKGTPVYNCAYEIMRQKHPEQPYALIKF